MKAQITISNLYWNKHLASFFLSSQAYKTLEDVVSKSAYRGADTLNLLDREWEDTDIEEVNGYLHDTPTADIMALMGIPNKTLLEDITSLEALADLINASDYPDYPYNLITAVIEHNGWLDRQFETYGIAYDPQTGRELVLDEDWFAVVK